MPMPKALREYWAKHRRKSSGTAKSSGGGSSHVAASPKRSAWERITGMAKPLEMLLFGLGGYFAGDVLNATGIPMWLYQHFPAYQAWADEGYNHISQEAFADGGGNAIFKGAGLATFLATLGAAAKKGGNLSSGGLNAALPFSIGAMIDAPEGLGTSTTYASADTGRW